MWIQRQITLRPRPRGFHLIGDEIASELPEIDTLETGLLHLLIQHTSASLALNENASPDVRADLETWFSDAVREEPSYWRHSLEGPDDMPAHVKSVLIGPSLTLPVSVGRWHSAPGRASTSASTATAPPRAGFSRPCTGSAWACPNPPSRNARWSDWPASCRPRSRAVRATPAVKRVFAASGELG